MVICQSVISLLVTIVELLSFSSFFSYFLWVTLFTFALLWHFISEKSLQEVKGVTLCLLKAVRRQLAISRPSCPLICAGTTSQWGNPLCEESEACFWRLDSSCWYLEILDLGTKHYIWVHLSPGMPEMVRFLQSITGKREASLAHQSEVIPIVNTQS